MKELLELQRLNDYKNKVDFRLPPAMDYLIYSILEQEDKLYEIAENKKLADIMTWLLNEFLFFGPTSKMDKDIKASYIGACYLLNINKNTGCLSDLVYIRENYSNLVISIQEVLDDKLTEDPHFNLNMRPGMWLLNNEFDRICNVIYHQYGANSHDTILQQSMGKSGNFFTELNLVPFAKSLNHIIGDRDFNEAIKDFKLCNL